MRACVAVISGLLLCACAVRDSFVDAGARTAAAGNWRIERQPDPITRAPLSSALLKGTSSHSNELFPLPAALQLSCFKDRPIVAFEFSFKVGTTPNSFLGYRFDERPGRDINARFLHTAQRVVIEDPAELAQFVRELASASVLYIRIRSLNAGRTTAEFRVAGAAEAIRAAFADCPLPPEPSRRGKTS